MATETLTCTGVLAAPADERVITPFSNGGRSSSRPFSPARFRPTCSWPGVVPEARLRVIHLALAIAVQARLPVPLLATIRVWGGGSCPGTNAYILKLRSLGAAAMVDFGCASTTPFGLSGFGAVVSLA